MSAEEVVAEDKKIPNLLEDNQKHIKIIGLYALAKDIKFKDSAEQRSFIKRNLRPAKDLEAYEGSRIKETMVYLRNNASLS